MNGLHLCEEINVTRQRPSERERYAPQINRDKDLLSERLRNFSYKHCLYVAATYRPWDTCAPCSVFRLPALMSSSYTIYVRWHWCVSDISLLQDTSWGEMTDFVVQCVSHWHNTLRMWQSLPSQTGEHFLWPLDKLNFILPFITFTLCHSALCYCNIH